jgi:hypothetical protein
VKRPRDDDHHQGNECGGEDAPAHAPIIAALPAGGAR